MTIKEKQIGTEKWLLKPTEQAFCLCKRKAENYFSVCECLSGKRKLINFFKFEFSVGEEKEIKY